MVGSFSVWLWSSRFVIQDIVFFFSIFKWIISSFNFSIFYLRSFIVVGCCLIYRTLLMTSFIIYLLKFLLRDFSFSPKISTILSLILPFFTITKIWISTFLLVNKSIKTIHFYYWLVIIFLTTSVCQNYLMKNQCYRVRLLRWFRFFSWIPFKYF